MNALAQLMSERLVDGLKRSAVDNSADWASLYRIMGSDSPFPGPWTFKHHPWLHKPHVSRAEMQIDKKAAQMGFSEKNLNKTFYIMDIEGASVLYILPNTKPDAADFSAARFDPAVEESPRLTSLFTNIKNTGLKRAGSASLYVRGSRSRAGLKSIPVRYIIIDEMDEMDVKKVALAFERASGQKSGDVVVIMTSTPSIEGMGIDKYFEDSSQEHYFFKCPHCSKYIDLDFDLEDPRNLVITADTHSDPKIKDSHLICHLCKGRLEHNAKTDFLSLENAIWVPAKKNVIAEGYTISQLYSTVMEPYKFAIAALKATLNPEDEQELFNSKLGKTHVVKGGRVTDDEIVHATGQYRTKENSSPNRITTMGIDVGTHLHYVIDEWDIKPRDMTVDLNLNAICRCIKADKVRCINDLSEIFELMTRYRINFAVMDANPETRLAINFCKRFPAITRRCYYKRGMTGKAITDRPEDQEIGVHRSSWLDMSLGRFHNGTIQLPFDISEEFKAHVKVPARIYSRDQDGNPVARYESGTKADHFAHARNYSEIALPLAVRSVTNMNIPS